MSFQKFIRNRDLDDKIRVLAAVASSEGEATIDYSDVTGLVESEALNILEELEEEMIVHKRKGGWYLTALGKINIKMFSEVV